MKTPKYLITLLSIILFVVLFFEKSLGLNVAIYGVSTIILLVAFKTIFFKPLIAKIVGAGLVLTSVFYYLYASPFTLFIVLLSFVLLIGLHTIVPLRNILYAIPNVLTNYVAAVSGFFASLRGRTQRKKTVAISKLFRIVFVPMFVVLLFVAMYSMGSSYFSVAIGQVFDTLEKWLGSIIRYIDVVALWTAFLGLLFGVIHSLALRTSIFSTRDSQHTDVLTRAKEKVYRRFRNLDLMVEYKSGVFLFSILSLLLSLFLYLEIKNVWIGFEWAGETLKELVHEGTFALIFAIFISMVVTIYYFRANLNFYKNNKTLQRLAYVWIGLNALLVVSVGVRTLYYIHYFGLAYKRIGVVVFLLLCIIGLVTLVMKINRRKSTYFVMRKNAMAAYIALVAVCMVNWDGVIARYNFSHYRTAFIHLPFMASLSDKALPYLQLTHEQVAEIEAQQIENIPFVRKGYYASENYKEKIDRRIVEFRKEYASRHWLESVWAESRAYQSLRE